MSRRSVAVAFVGLAAGIGACGDSQHVSCNLTAVCIDYGGEDGITSDSVTRVRSACESTGGTFSDFACTTAGRIGTCAVTPSDGVTRFIRVYSAANLTASDAQLACFSGQLSGTANLAGNWTTG